MGSKQLEHTHATNGLNDDLLVEVVLRLPYESVIRFKCISKQWYSVISEFNFVSQFLNPHHMKISMKRKEGTLGELPWVFVGLAPRKKNINIRRKLEFLAGSACLNHAKLVSKCDLPFLSREPQPSMRVIGSSKDLILCVVRYSNNKCYYICNPVSKQCVALPPLTPYAQDTFHFTMISEPTSTNVRLGLGSQYRYKVVGVADHLSKQSSDKSLELVIFSSETGLWCEHVLSCSSVRYPFRYIRKVVMARFGQSMMCVVKNEFSLIIFDPYMAYDHIVIPCHSICLPIEYIRRCHRHIGEVFTSQGGLVLCEQLLLSGHPYPRFTVWELETSQNQKQWRIIHQVHMDEMKPVAAAAPTPVEDHHRHLGVDDWWKEILLNKADPYDEKHKRSWVANFLKSAGRPWFLDKHEVACVGFHPCDANIMFLVLACFHLPPPERFVACLAAYDMRTRTLELVPQEKVPDDPKCRSALLRSLLFDRCTPYGYNLFPVVLQPWPTPLFSTS